MYFIRVSSAFLRRRVGSKMASPFRKLMELQGVRPGSQLSSVGSNLQKKANKILKMPDLLLS